MLRKVINIGVAAGAFAMVALPALAALPTKPPDSPVTSYEQMMNAITNVQYLIYALFGILAVIMFIWAAIEYITAGGDANKLSTAKQRVMYGIIAIIIVVLSIGMFTLIKNILTTFIGTPAP